MKPPLPTRKTFSFPGATSPQTKKPITFIKSSTGTPAGSPSQSSGSPLQITKGCKTCGRR